MVELAGNERARASNAFQLVPDGPHGPCPHAAQRLREAGGPVVHPLGAHLRHERRAASLKPGEHREAAPVVDESLEPICLDPLRQCLIAAAPPLARLVLETGMGADREQREDPFRMGGRDMEGEPPPHGVAHQVGARDPEVVPQHHEVGSAGLHGVWATRADAGVAVAAKVGHHPPPAAGHVGDDLVPAAPALGESVENGDRRTFADHLIVESNVGPFQKHRQILWM